MSIVDNKHSKKYVITYKELLFTFIVFVVILFVLYPKDLLKEQILSEESNYDLSMLYLKNLIKQDPDNESLMIILAEQSLRSGKKDLSLRLLNLLVYSENIEYRDKATLLSYDLKKDDYNFLTEEQEQLEQKNKLKDLFSLIMDRGLYSDTQEDTKKWYGESVFLQDYEYMYFFIQKMLIQEPYNIELLKEAYYISSHLKEEDAALKYVTKLASLGEVDKEKWITDRYYLLVNKNDNTKVESVLRENENKSTVWKERFANFLLMKAKYKEASKKYMELYDSSENYVNKKAYFKQAISVLQAGNYSDKSAALAKKYEKQFIHDKEMRKYILKLYIATGDLDNAASLSDYIFKREMK